MKLLITILGGLSISACARDSVPAAKAFPVGSYFGTLGMSTGLDLRAEPEGTFHISSSHDTTDTFSQEIAGTWRWKGEQLEIIRIASNPFTLKEGSLIDVEPYGLRFTYAAFADEPPLYVAPGVTPEESRRPWHIFLKKMP